MRFYLDLLCLVAKYLTSLISSKSASCVHNVALYSRAVDSMMLSAIGSLNSSDSLAALSATPR